MPRSYHSDFNKVKKEDVAELCSPGSIKCKIDWFTVIFYDCSVRQALTSLCGLTLPNGFDFDDTFNHCFLSSQGYLPVFVFNFNGIDCRVSEKDVSDVIPLSQVECCDSFKFFDLQFRKIRLEISGTGLDRLRSDGIDVDSLFFRPLPMQTDIMAYHVTRVDVAFDFLDYRSDFLDKCISWCQENGNPYTHRVAVGNCAGLKYSIGLGDKKTLYLGSGASDRLLRIYDKGLQYENSKLVFPYVYDDGTFPKSWIRVEIQTRRELETSKILYSLPEFKDSTECFLGVFRYIYERFGFYKDGKTVDLWRDLFEWDKVVSILSKTVILFNHRDPNFVRAETYIRTNGFSSIVIFLAEHGWKAFIDMINHQFISMQRSNNPFDKMRFNTQMVKILDGRASLPNYIYRDRDGFYYIGNPS